MLDTVGPELQVVNKTGKEITLKENEMVTLTPDLEQDATSDVLPINFSGLAKVSKIISTSLIVFLSLFKIFNNLNLCCFLISNVCSFI